MRVLVTGHRGYIGSPLVERLKAAGHEVVGVDTELYEDCTFGVNKDSGIPTINRDIRELSPADLEGIDAIAHLAGICNDPLGDLLPETTYDINHAATVQLARLAKASGARRFVFSSSCSVYGAAGQEWIDEQSEPNPITPYGLSKWNAEIELSQLAGDQFSPVFLRSATAYGFSPRIRFDLVLNNLTAHGPAHRACCSPSPWRARHGWSVDALCCTDQQPGEVSPVHLHSYEAKSSGLERADPPLCEDHETKVKVVNVHMRVACNRAARPADPSL